MSHHHGWTGSVVFVSSSPRLLLSSQSQQDIKEPVSEGFLIIQVSHLLLHILPSHFYHFYFIISPPSSPGPPLFIFYKFYQAVKGDLMERFTAGCKSRATLSLCQIHPSDRITAGSEFTPEMRRRWQKCEKHECEHRMGRVRSNRESPEIQREIRR